MKKLIIERVLKEANYIINTNSTIRETSERFNVSKSTTHKDIHERLKNIDKIAYKNIQKIMKNHIKQRHINGGIATKIKYLKNSSKIMKNIL